MVLFSRYYRVRPRCKVTNTNTNSGPLGANTKRIERRRGCGGGGVRCVVKVICAVGGGALVHFVVFVIEKKRARIRGVCIAK